MQKKTVHKIVMIKGKRNIIRQLLQAYDIQSAEHIQEGTERTAGRYDQRNDT